VRLGVRVRVLLHMLVPVLLSHLEIA
jgi:hypothetical protein